MTLELLGTGIILQIFGMAIGCGFIIFIAVKQAILSALRIYDKSGGRR